MASDVGSILLIVGASLIGIGAIALSASTYSIDDMLTKPNNRALNNINNKKTNESDTKDTEIKTNILQPNDILNKDLSKINFKNTDENDPYTFKGGKQSRKSKSKKSKSKSKKNKYKN